MIKDLRLRLERDIRVVDLDFRYIGFWFRLINCASFRWYRGSGTGRTTTGSAQHDHIVSYNFSAVILFTVCSFPGPGLEATFDVNLGTFFQILTDNFAELAPGDDIMELGLFFFLAVVFIGPIEAGRDREGS